MDLVAPTWVTALRGLGVVCNIYNIAKASDDVVDDLEEKMGWMKKRRAKKDIKRHYNGRVKELNSECKDTIKMMKRGNSEWKELLYQPEPTIDLSESEKDEVYKQAIEARREIGIRIESRNKSIEDFNRDGAKYFGVNQGLAEESAAAAISLERANEEDAYQLITLKSNIAMLKASGCGREQFDLTPVYEGLTRILEREQELKDLRSHRDLKNKMYDVETGLETEREFNEMTSRPEIHSSAIAERLNEYALNDQTHQSELAKAQKKGSDLESLVSQARAVGV